MGKTLTSYIVIFHFLILPEFVSGQSEPTRSPHIDTIANQTRQKQPIDADFLINYYKQEGDHSAVTGGEGTEKLSDIGLQVIINLPIDSASRLILNSSLSHYSSASTDNIDFNVSSASRYDNRGSFNFAYERDQAKTNTSFRVSVGASLESDYLSNSIGLSWSKSSKDKNKFFSISGAAFFDKWIMIFPEELRSVGHLILKTDKRRTYDLSANYLQVFGQKLQASIHPGITFQKGLISTPFHRVYFQNDSTGLEVLPNTRIKFPLGLRLNYFAADKFVFRLFYRLYTDSYGIHSHTFNIETPYKPSALISFYPFYRYYTQSAADDFKASGEHAVNSIFHTSDYDLSSFSSHKFGLGLRYSPLYGLFRRSGSMKNGGINSIGLRCALYYRSDGLSAFIISSRFSFQF